MHRIVHARRSAYVLSATAIVWALTASGAQAATITIGSPLTDTFSSVKACDPVCTGATIALPGATLASPVNGTIVRWRILDASGGPFKLRVLRPASGGAYTGAGTSSPVTPTSLGLQTFTTNLPIHAGDLIGIDNGNPSDKIGVATPSGAQTDAFSPQIPDGSTESPAITVPAEIALQADVQTSPAAVASISPASGSIKGGTAVVITGHDFTSATSVRFGSVPAASFTVSSDTQIKAVSPAVPAPGPVDVIVTTPAGATSLSAADKFVYTACVVPKLKGKKLKAAKKALLTANCALGKVKPKGKKSGKVKKQKPKAGLALAPGAKVSVKLG